MDRKSSPPGDIVLAEGVTRGEPRPQPRPRATRRGRGIRVYDPPNAKLWKSLVEASTLDWTFYEEGPFDGGLAVDTLFLLPRPQRLMRKKDPEGFIEHISTPDNDNMIKAYLDGINQSHRVWRDDSQVVENVACKLYHEKCGEPRAYVRIRRFTQPRWLPQEVLGLFQSPTP